MSVVSVVFVEVTTEITYHNGHPAVCSCSVIHTCLPSPHNILMSGQHLLFEVCVCKFAMKLEVKEVALNFGNRGLKQS